VKNVEHVPSQSLSPRSLPKIFLMAFNFSQIKKKKRKILNIWILDAVRGNNKVLTGTFSTRRESVKRSSRGEKCVWCSSWTSRIHHREKRLGGSERGRGGMTQRATHACVSGCISAAAEAAPEQKNAALVRAPDSFRSLPL
jgi:hypothetical protein